MQVVSNAVRRLTLQALVAGHTVEGREAPGYAGKPRELAAGAPSQRKGV